VNLRISSLDPARDQPDNPSLKMTVQAYIPGSVKASPRKALFLLSFVGPALITNAVVQEIPDSRFSPQSIQASNSTFALESAHKTLKQLQFGGACSNFAQYIRHGAPHQNPDQISAHSLDLVGNVQMAVLRKLEW
jgi:hypothetical protein